MSNRNSILEENRYPHEVNSSCDAWRLASTFGIAITMFLIVNLLSQVVLNSFSGNLGYNLIEKKWQILKELDSPVEVLILGDSSCNQAVVPELLQSSEFSTVLNLCTTGNTTALEDAWMLDYYLTRHDSLKAVIVVHAYDTWFRNLRPSALAQIPLRWGFWKSIGPSLEIDYKYTIQVLLAKYFPMYSENRSLSAIVLRPWSIVPPRLNLSPLGFMSGVQANPLNVISDANIHKEYVRNNNLIVTQDNLKALHHLSYVAKSRRLKIVFANAPMYDRLYSDDQVRSVLHGANDTISLIVNSNESLEFIFAEPRLFSADDMQSVDHLATESAPTYTMAISEAMNALK